MSKIRFDSGVEFNATMIELMNVYSHGADRQSLQIHFDNKDNIFDDLANFAKNNLSSGRIIIEDNETEYVYTNYEIFHSLKYDGKEYVLTIAQLTEQEIKYNELLRRIEALER